MKRILFVATCNIAVRTGGGLANLAYYNAFNKLFPGKVDLAMAEEYCVDNYGDAIKIPSRNILVRLMSLLRGEIHRNKRFFKHFLKQNADKYSYCIINGGVYAGDMIDIFHSKGIKVIVIHHNFEREYKIDNRTLITLWGATSFFVNRNEKKAYKKSDANCFLTLSDIQLFRYFYGSTSSFEFLLGVFEPEPVLKEVSLNVKKTNTIVVTGSMNSLQTVDGIMNFRENYFDKFIHEYPDWKIIFAGRNPSAKIDSFKNLYPDKIEVIANPPIMNDIIDLGRVFLCPTRIGGGLKLRIMDGLRKGLPIITHKVSARGYDEFWKYPFFQVYDDYVTFRKGFSAILDYINNRDGYQQEIQNIYNSYFSFESGCKRVELMMKYFK